MFTALGRIALRLTSELLASGKVKKAMDKVRDGVRKD
jgi:hypothetical protein